MTGAGRMLTLGLGYHRGFLLTLGLGAFGAITDWLVRARRHGMR